MSGYLQWLAAAAGFVVLAPLAVWLGVALGRKTARRYPAVVGALWMFSVFLKLDPPPPPKAERVTRSEEDAGAPPKV